MKLVLLQATGAVLALLFAGYGLAAGLLAVVGILAGLGASYLAFAR